MFCQGPYVEVCTPWRATDPSSVQPSKGYFNCSLFLCLGLEVLSHSLMFPFEGLIAHFKKQLEIKSTISGDACQFNKNKKNFDEFYINVNVISIRF